MNCWIRRAALPALLGVTIVALAAPSAQAGGATITVRTVKVGKPGNPSVGIVPFTDAIYQSCSDAPQTKPACQMVAIFSPSG